MGESTNDFLHWSRLIRSMSHNHINILQLQPFQRVIHSLNQMLPTQSNLIRRITLPSTNLRKEKEQQEQKNRKEAKKKETETGRTPPQKSLVEITKSSLFQPSFLIAFPMAISHFPSA